MTRMLPCWSCGVSDGPCVEPCECAKCINPEGYETRRRENPRSYALWMARNAADDEAADEW